MNEFKKVPGFGGFVLNSNGDGVAGVAVTVKMGGNTYTAYTNADGFYMISYKTGKSQSYTVSAFQKSFILQTQE